MYMQVLILNQVTCFGSNRLKSVVEVVSAGEEGVLGLALGGWGRFGGVRGVGVCWDPSLLSSWTVAFILVELGEDGVDEVG